MSDIGNSALGAKQPDAFGARVTEGAAAKPFEPQGFNHFDINPERQVQIGAPFDPIDSTQAVQTAGPQAVA